MAKILIANTCVDGVWYGPDHPSKVTLDVRRELADNPRVWGDSLLEPPAEPDGPQITYGVDEDGDDVPNVRFTAVTARQPDDDYVAQPMPVGPLYDTAALAAAQAGTLDLLEP